jgi:DNA-3-methyladenine glycosylase
MNSRKVSTRWRDVLPFREIEARTEILPADFYARPTVAVARDLLGKILVHGRAAGRIIEVEAYLGSEDRAAHASRGITPRTKVIYGPPGRAYVYFVYGMHECLNLVAEPEGTPGCVLIRALEPLCGIRLMKRRSPAARRVEDLTSGPGRLTRALGITRAHYGRDVTSGDLTVRRLLQEPPFEIHATPRIGIRHCAEWPLRFVLVGSPLAAAVPWKALKS